MRHSPWGRTLRLVFSRALVCLGVGSGGGVRAAHGVFVGDRRHGERIGRRQCEELQRGHHDGRGSVGGYWTVTPAGAVTPHGGAPALGSPAALQPLAGQADRRHDGHA